MLKTLRISFALRNTYRVNGILYSLKQIPLLKKVLPQTLYKVKGLKIFANVLSVIWEVVSIFIGKFLYFVTMIYGIGMLYEKTPADQTYLHILLLLTFIGAWMNTNLFNPTRDKYYAMILMRMNAREYTLVNYIYAILKVIVGFLPFSIWFGLDRGIPLWFCILFPFSVVGMKMAVAASSLWDYEKRGLVYNENKLAQIPLGNGRLASCSRLWFTSNRNCFPVNDFYYFVSRLYSGRMCGTVEDPEISGIPGDQSAASGAA